MAVPRFSMASFMGGPCGAPSGAPEASLTGLQTRTVPPTLISWRVLQKIAEYAMPDVGLFEAVEHLREELYRIKQQLQFYAQLTVHETRSPVTIQCETFSVAMNHLARQVEAAIEYAEAMQSLTKEKDSVS